MAEFVCLRGDCDNYALTKDNCFVVQDELGRDWLCYETENIIDEIDDVKEQVTQMQERCYSLGMAGEGTSISVALYIERSLLPEWLAGT